MRINYISFLSLLLSLILISCIRTNKISTTGYQNDLKQFPTDMVDFFPDPESINGMYSTSKNVDTTSECIFYMFFDFEAKDILKFKKYAQDKSIGSYLASDSLLITIKRRTIIDWDISKKAYYENLFRSDTQYYPVPFFETMSKLDYIGIDKDDIFSNKNTSGLSNSFVFYILDSKSGQFWDGLKPNEFMPESWKNGYSKGICINEKENITIYWLIIW
ncbi:hypothetical protein [Marinifilum caeruleilacunae]|uniref:Lipoprotein n=1 Tax=Marinifilum caeruleilacunae TaxID=2499076 RepID=A0ABX1WUJ7_9BACT|nr:hypothetical protein [Marinifilum caeruleilacunae]NOU59615.1 hypothetical protein [Marinifilum caeruleilacunae]